MARRRCSRPWASIRDRRRRTIAKWIPQHRELLLARIAEIKSKIGTGGLREAGIRALLYVGSARGMVDERSLEALRRLRQADESARITLAEFKMLVREQFFMLLLDQEAALAAIPKLLPDSMDDRRRVFAAIQEVLSASAEISGEVAKRLAPRRRTVRHRPRSFGPREKRDFAGSEGEGVVVAKAHTGNFCGAVLLIRILLAERYAIDRPVDGADKAGASDDIAERYRYEVVDDPRDGDERGVDISRNVTGLDEQPCQWAGSTYWPRNARSRRR